MAVTFQGKRVSRGWRTILRCAWDMGVRFQLNSGQRTMAEQALLVRQKGVWSPVNRTGAALPNRNAPHIRAGRPNHAVDIDTVAYNGEYRMQEWVERRGVDWQNTVPGEAWHGEVSLAGFLKLHRYAVAYFARKRRAEAKARRDAKKRAAARRRK